MTGRYGRTIVVTLVVLAAVVLYAASDPGEDALGGELAQIERLVTSAMKMPEEIDRVRLELWPKLALLPLADRQGALEILLRVGVATQDERTRRLAIESLGALGGAGLGAENRSSAVEWLLGVARDPKAAPLTRGAAIAAVPELDTSERVTAALYEIATSSSLDSQPQLGQRTSLQEAAIRALGQCGTADAAERLFRLWGDESVRPVLGEVILQSLAHSGDSRTQALLIERIENGNKQSNELVSTIQALGGLARVRLTSSQPSTEDAQRTAEVKSTLRALCEGGYHPDVIAIAAIALAGITPADDRTTIEFLQKLSHDLEERDRETLESVLGSQLRPSG